jgi:hypothetical protein
MGSALIIGAVGLGGLVMLVAIAALKTLVTKMVSDELRARVDDLPATLVGLALRLLPPDKQDYYRPEWEGDLLAAYNDKTSRYPVTRFFNSFKFAFPLMVHARRIRKETKFIQQAAKNDEQQERLMQAGDARAVPDWVQALLQAGGPEADLVQAVMQGRDRWTWKDDQGEMMIDLNAVKEGLDPMEAKIGPMIVQGTRPDGTAVSIDLTQHDNASLAAMEVQEWRSQDLIELRDSWLEGSWLPSIKDDD